MRFQSIVGIISKVILVTHLNVVPPIALQLLNNPLASEGDFTSIKCLMNAAAPCMYRPPANIHDELECSIEETCLMIKSSEILDFRKERC